MNKAKEVGQKNEVKKERRKLERKGRGMRKMSRLYVTRQDPFWVPGLFHLRKDVLEIMKQEMEGPSADIA